MYKTLNAFLIVQYVEQFQGPIPAKNGENDIF